MASNFGRLFKLGKKHPPKKPCGFSSDEDEGYVDPTQSCSTEPPETGARKMFPNYPPPRITGGSPKLTAKNNVKKDEYQDPWDSRNKKSEISANLNDTYDDPFDAKKTPDVGKNKLDYQDPFDSKNEVTTQYVPGEAKAAENYTDPWDSKKTKPTESTKKLNIVKPPRSSNVKITKKKDDYSVPWDSKDPNNSSKSLDEYDDTYSEPYDKNKQTVIDDLKQRSTVEEDANNDEDDDEIYDMPYEERVTIGIEPNVNGTTQPYTSAKTKSLPLAPPLSNCDYDAPWDWKAKNLEADFQKRFSVGVDQTMSVKQKAVNKTKPVVPSLPESHKTQPHSKADNPDKKCTPFCKEYEVDPTIPLKNQGWFHGSIRRGEAEELLKCQPDCSYLIRDSESSKENYSLSLKNNGETMHLKISCENGKYILGMNSRPYDTIPEMIHHYSKSKLNIRGAERVKLICPVLQEAMYFVLES